MPRLQFQPAARYPFVTELQIYASHINEGGHLDNVQLLSLVAEARGRFFASLGYSVLDVAGHVFFVGDQAVQYKSEGFHGQTLRIEMAPADFNPKGFDLVYRVSEAQSGREVALGKIGLVCVDPGSRKPSAIPETFWRQLQAL
ncbi:thioesterase family protein [Malikia sp.]|uniref:acyl-CoA thioesterase n=1 Tax=Malikia sp. TaxID=2070706 RepID=UPI00261E15E5|nr:thioesterase family protein [Malikia sp.]MDD2729958.1 thioesterase family protein [Malikia sp.]